MCLLGDQAHCDEAKKEGVPFMSQEDLKKLNKDKKKVNIMIDIFTPNKKL